MTPEKEAQARMNIYKERLRIYHLYKRNRWLRLFIPRRYDRVTGEWGKYASLIDKEKGV